MNDKLSPRHSVHRIFVVMIFGLFLLFLLLMLLFGARAYSVSVAGSQKNNNLYTATAYVTAKFRQHDTGTDQEIYCDTLGNSQALCMTDIIEGAKYITYIYLQDNSLKELFTATDTSPSPEMGYRKPPVTFTRLHFRIAREKKAAWFCTPELHDRKDNYYAKA